jgi:p-aminobenzoyl-glutamate transporter AbgT
VLCFLVNPNVWIYGIRFNNAIAQSNATNFGLATSLFTSENINRLIVEMPRTLTGFAPLGLVLRSRLQHGSDHQAG